MPPRIPTRLLRVTPRPLPSNTSSHHHHLLRLVSLTPQLNNPLAIRMTLPPTTQFNPNSRIQLQSRFYSTTGKSQADQIVDELQELYETAKDEFEIATESTDGATIYAASDRESARDALTQLLTVYSLYTSDLSAGVERKKDGQEAEGEESVEDADEGRIVDLEFDPAEVGGEVREEVRRRVGQRVRELEAAVVGLEGRAKSD